MLSTVNACMSGGTGSHGSGRQGLLKLSLELSLKCAQRKDHLRQEGGKRAGSTSEQDLVQEEEALSLTTAVGLKGGAGLAMKSFKAEQSLGLCSSEGVIKGLWINKTIWGHPIRKGKFKEDVLGRV